MNFEIAALLAVLAKAFPSGIDEGRLDFYLDQVARTNPDPLDLSEAVQRIIHTRESRSFPSVAEILRRLQEARGDRLKRVDEGPPQIDGMTPLGPLQRAEMRVWRELACYGLTYCDVDRDYNNGRHCSCDPICHGAEIPMAEAEEKLAWAAEHLNPVPRRVDWLKALQPMA